MPRLIYYRTDWSRRLAKLKKKRPKLDRQIKFGWVDVGRDIYPNKIDYTGIRIAIPSQRVRKYFLRKNIKSPQSPYRAEWVTTIAFEKGRVSHRTIRSYLKKMGYKRFKKVSENIWDAYA